MNICLDILIVAIAVFTVVFSYKKGLIKALSGVISLVVAIFLIGVYAAPLGRQLNEKVISPFVSEKILASMETEENADSQEVKDDELSQNKTFSYLLQGDIKGFIAAAREDAYDITAKEFVSGMLFKSLVLEGISIGIVTILIFALTRLAIWLIELILKPIFKKTAVAKLNKFLGLILGIIKSVLMIMLVILIVDGLSGTYKPKTPNGSFKSEVEDKTYVYKYAKEYIPIKLN